MLKIWNASLVLATGMLAILGTFLVRSGILESIHAFGASTLGVPFLLLIATMVVRLGRARRLAAGAELRSEHRLDSLLSREAVFLLNNLVLVAMCLVIWWGTFFPLISEAVTGQQARVGPPWFDRYTVPLALLLVLLSGIGPVIAWRRRRARTCAATSSRRWAPAAAVLVVARGVRRRPPAGALIMFGLAAFVIGTSSRSSRAGRARAARWRASRRRSRWSRSCAATAGATAATWCTPA